MKIDIDKYKAFFFDFDGVVVDSLDIKTEAFGQLYEPFGEEIMLRVKEYHLANGGVSRFEKIRYYHRNLLNKEISQEQVSALAEKFSDIVFAKVMKAPFISGVIEFLDLLKQNQKKMFVISATPDSEIKRIVGGRQLDKYFLDIKGSPIAKKENLSCLIKKEKVDVSKCVYFGDALQDFNAAISLGVAFVPINFFDKQKGYKDFVDLMM
jgi:HAD superfamily hydrolase (TIGR01549 family)